MSRVQLWPFEKQGEYYETKGINHNPSYFIKIALNSFANFCIDQVAPIKIYDE